MQPLALSHTGWNEASASGDATARPGAAGGSRAAVAGLALGAGLAALALVARGRSPLARASTLAVGIGTVYEAMGAWRRGTPVFDRSLALLADPYRFIGAECRRRHVHAFETSLLLERTVCMSGARAAEVFYDGARFRREGAAPEPLRATLFGKGAVQSLDGYAHRHRKALFLAATSPGRVAALARHASREWERAIDRWRTRDSVRLYPAAREVLTRAVCAWAGVPLDERHVAARTAQFAALFDQAARGLLDHLRSRIARKRLEHWLATLIHDHRTGESTFPEGSVAEEAARHTDGFGRPLAPRIAAVELLNILRPTVAVSVYVTFAAHAMQTRPECRAKLRSGDERYLDAFVQEVRRWYPFFPSVMARARSAFVFEGVPIARDERVVLDLYGTNHERAVWGDPHAFRPERFLERAPGPFEFVPQGGGDVASGHRCPGEGVAVALMKGAIDVLLRRVAFDVPAQDLRIAYHRLPAIPRSGFRMTRVHRPG